MENKQAEKNFSLPLSLRYNLGVADAVPSSKNIAQFLASNASDFTPSNNTIRIPVGSPAFLDLRCPLTFFPIPTAAFPSAIANPTLNAIT